MDEHDTSTHPLLVEEYRSLRGQIDYLIRDITSLERWAVIVSGALWSWLATRGSDLPLPTYWCPLAMTFLFGLRALGLYTQIDTTGRYLRDLEGCLPRGAPRWEHFLQKNKARFKN